MHAIRVAIITLAALSCAGAPLEARGFTAQDLVALDRLSDLAASPDGRHVAFVRRVADLATDRGRTDLWLLSMAEGSVRRLTSHEAADGSPQWISERTLLFLSARSGSSQVWRLSLDGGEALQVTDLPLDVATFRATSDGSRLVVSLDVFLDCESLVCSADRLRERESGKATGQRHERLFARHWDAWEDGRRSHLWVLKLDDEGGPLRGEGAVDLLRGMDADCPSPPFGGVEEYALSPDGRTLVFAARDASTDEAWSTDFDLFSVPIDGSSAPVNLTDSNPAWDTQPLFSPDGETLAYLSMSRPGYESDRFRILARDWASGREREVTEGWDRSPQGLLFAADGRTLYATAADVGQVPLFAIDLTSGEVRTLVPSGHVRWPVLTREGVVFGWDNLAAPVDLFVLGAEDREPRRLTSVNAERLAGVEMGAFEQFHFAGWRGETVYGFVVKPSGFDPAKRYPIALLIHGGPQGSFSNDFHYRWNAQVYAGAGYGVVTVDFHGSTGYGQAFTDSIRHDWGGKPLADLQLGLEASLAAHEWLDGERACALGASYGGYLVNWIAGQWADRFDCLVNHDGVFDQRSMYYSTEELWFPEWEHGGPYFENPAQHELHNPVRHVDRWQTPMLVVHGGRDFRVPETQGIAAFTALQRRGIPSQLLYFPDENHWVLRSSNSLLWHQTVLDWLGRWTAEDPLRPAGQDPNP